MTGRRASGQALRQSRTLDALGIARRRTPGPTAGTLVGDALPMLAVLAALELAGTMARLGRASADPADDNRWRRVVVILNSAARAVADDIQSGNVDASTRLYLVVTAMQQGKGPK